jgi:thioredoxin reductase (NADPH)
VHRRNEFRASKIMLERAHRVANIDWLTQYVIEELVSGEGGALEGVRLRDTHGDPVRELSITGAFIAVGHEPQSQLVRGQVDIDPAGYVLTEGKSTRTSYAGVFAAGDLVDHTYRQAVTAAGSGCQAALDAERYLRDAAPVEARRPEADAISSLRSSPAPADLMLPPSEVAAVAADG